MIKSDLSNVKVGDYILTLRDGWQKVLKVFKGAKYFIHCEVLSFNIDGKEYIEDKYPTAFTKDQVPPQLLELYGPCPCEFKKGDRVLVSTGNGIWERRYFSHAAGNGFYCFSCGSDEWSSNNETSYRRYCKKWEEE